MRTPPKTPTRKSSIAAGIAATGAALAMVATSAPAAHAIIGGTEVPNDAYPFMTAVLEKGRAARATASSAARAWSRPTRP